MGSPETGSRRDPDFEAKITEAHRAALADMKVGETVTGELDGRRYEITLQEPVTSENPDGGLKMEYEG